MVEKLSKKILYGIASSLLLLAMTNESLAKGPGSTGADFLKIGVGPRQVGLGDQGAALAEDAFSLHYNPASIALLDYQQLSLMHNRWIEGISQQYVGWVHPDRNVTAGASFNLLRFGTIQGYDAQGAKATEFSAEDFSTSLALARRLWGSSDPEEGTSFYGGASAKFIKERLELDSASAFGMDAGAITQFHIEEVRVRVGLSAQNFGTPVKYYQKSAPLPSKIALGVSAFTRYFWGDPFTLALEFRQAPHEDKRDFSIGAEYWTNKVLALRIGYKSQEDLGNGIRFGIALKIKPIQFDYGLSMMEDFGHTHRAGITMQFGAPIERTPTLTPQEQAAKKAVKRARRLSQEGRYLEAILEINQALELDPGSTEALALLKNIKNRIEEQERKK